jgi:hypothetical protein
VVSGSAQNASATNIERRSATVPLSPVSDQAANDIVHDAFVNLYRRPAAARPRWPGADAGVHD